MFFVVGADNAASGRQNTFPVRLEIARCCKSWIIKCGCLHASSPRTVSWWNLNYSLFERTILWAPTFSIPPSLGQSPARYSILFSSIQHDQNAVPTALVARKRSPEEKEMKRGRTRKGIVGESGTSPQMLAVWTARKRVRPAAPGLQLRSIWKNNRGHSFQFNEPPPKKNNKNNVIFFEV